MPYAVTLRLDAASAASITAMWTRLFDAGLDPARRERGYPPHLTLAVYPDDAGAAAIFGAVEDLAARWTALSFTLSGFGIFPPPSNVLFAAPVATAALLSRHEDLLAALPALEPHPHHGRDAWVPHVTLCEAPADPARAVAALLPRWQALAGWLDAVDVVRFSPVTVLQHLALRQR